MRRALFLVCLVALGGCGSSDDSETFDKSGFDITFEYPAEMNEADNVTIASGAGSSAKATEGIGFSKKDVIIVQRYDLNRSVGKDELGAAKAELDGLVQQLSSNAQPGRTGTVGGFPSIEYEDLEVRQFEGARTKLVAIFDGDTEYLFNCQYTPDRKNDIEEACDQVLESVEKK